MPNGANTQATDWQRAAGGHMEFDVASIREDPSGKYLTPPFSIDSDNDYKSTGGIFEADAPVPSYIAFAYKLNQQHSMIQHLPSWASKVHFQVKAKGAPNATKDQLRLMMQSLLADRLKLALHFETQVMPVMIMSELKPNTLGPRLRLHSDGPACDAEKPHPSDSEVTLDMFPCNIYMAIDKPENVIMGGARNTTMSLMAAFFSNVGKVPPVIDRTGITETVDFSMEWTRPPKHAAGEDDVADLPGMTFVDAVKTQLGLNLQPARLPLQIPVVDHLERPSEN